MSGFVRSITPMRPNGGSVGGAHLGDRDDAGSGLRASDKISLSLLFLASGGITGLALGGNVLLALSVFGAIVAGGVVGWFLHSLAARGRPVRGGNACSGLPGERRA